MLKIWVSGFRHNIVLTGICGYEIPFHRDYSYFSCLMLVRNPSTLTHTRQRTGPVASIAGSAWSSFSHSGRCGCGRPVFSRGCLAAAMESPLQPPGILHRTIHDVECYLSLYMDDSYSERNLFCINLHDQFIDRFFFYKKTLSLITSGFF